MARCLTGLPQFMLTEPEHAQEEEAGTVAETERRTASESTEEEAGALAETEDRRRRWHSEPTMD